MQKQFLRIKLTLFKNELIHFVNVFFCDEILSFFKARILSFSNVGVAGGTYDILEVIPSVDFVKFNS